MTTQTITPERLTLLITDALKKDRFFSVTTRKREDNSERRFISRHTLYKNKSGIKKPYDPVKKGLISLFDYTQRDGKLVGWRSLNIDDLISARIDGVTYKVARKPVAAVISITLI